MIWMSRLLFVVDDHFDIRERGLILAPGIEPIGDERFTVGSPLLLKRPDGSSIETTIGGLEMLLTPKPTTQVPILLKGLGKSDVPIGTEVWSR